MYRIFPYWGIALVNNVHMTLSHSQQQATTTGSLTMYCLEDVLNIVFYPD